MYKIWKHPSGHFSLDLKEGWKIDPVIINRPDLGIITNTVVKITLSKNGYNVDFMHYPCNGVPDNVMKKALTGTLLSLGININWSERVFVGHRAFISEANIWGRTMLVYFARRGYLGFKVEVYNENVTNTNELMRVLGNVVSSVGINVVPGAITNSLYKNLRGKWIYSPGEWREGKSVSDSAKSWTFNFDGTAEYYEKSGFSSYGGDANVKRTTAYYKILDDNIYFYSDVAAVFPFSLNRGVMQIGSQRYIKQ